MESAMKCAEEVGGEACLSAEEAVNDADIIVTATSSKAPILKSSWIKPGAHINGTFQAFVILFSHLNLSCNKYHVFGYQLSNTGYTIGYILLTYLGTLVSIED